MIISDEIVDKIVKRYNSMNLENKLKKIIELRKAWVADYVDNYYVCKYLFTNSLINVHCQILWVYLDECASNIIFLTLFPHFPMQSVYIIY